ncbi:hypothetical protein PBI_GRAYSON_265 [Rhodococcus phage Grayson]|nr:hypothetical protein PBI_GRAYSON_265 [Rhodococcus phage Grayson]
MGAKNRRQKDKCKAKTTYSDMNKANLAIKMLYKRKDYTGKVWAYRCSICKGIHIGHPSTKQRQAVTQRIIERKRKG